MNNDDKFKFRCDSCSTQLSAREKHIGRSVKCPKCKVELVVPDGLQPEPIVEVSPEIDQGQWYMRDSKSEVFGPCSKPELDEWSQSGAMNAQCFIREGRRPWIPAANAYPGVIHVKPIGGGQAIGSTSLSPGIAVLLSLLLVGLPQILMGQVGKGIAILCGGVLFGVLTGCIGVPFVWAFAAVDAFKIAQKIEAGQPVTEWEFF